MIIIVYIKGMYRNKTETIFNFFIETDYFFTQYIHIYYLMVRKYQIKIITKYLCALYEIIMISTKFCLIVQKIKPWLIMILGQWIGTNG